MPSDSGQIVLGVDLDGVCADFYGRIREIAAEWFERPIETLTRDVSYGLSEWGITGEDYDSLHRFAVTERDFFRSVPMIPGALVGFECERHAVHDGGDHAIFVGKVLGLNAVANHETEPLVFFAGRYCGVRRSDASPSELEFRLLHGW